MSTTRYPHILEQGELIQFRTLDRFSATFGAEPRRLREQQFTYMLISVKQGKGHCFIDNEYVALQAGTLLIVSPFSFLHLDHTQYVQGSVILFTEEFLCRTHQQEQLFYKTVFGPNRRTFFQLGDNEFANSFLQLQVSMFGWEYRFGKDPLLKLDLLQNILAGMVLYLHKLQLEQERASYDIVEPLAKSQVVQFIQLLNTHFREESSLTFYAEKMGISMDMLSQACKKGVGWSPKAIMQEKLLREAKRLLLFDMMSVKEISYELGFSEPTNFVKFFQQHTGISPKNFRLQHCITGLSEQDHVA